MCILMRIALFMRALKTLDTAIYFDQTAGFYYWMLCGRLDARRTEESRSWTVKGLLTTLMRPTFGTFFLVRQYRVMSGP